MGPARPGCWTLHPYLRSHQSLAELVARCPGKFTFDRGEDLVGCFGPDERVATVVPAVDEGPDLAGQVSHGWEDAAADGLAFDDAEPDLDQVQPGPGGRGEVGVDPWV